MKRALLQAWEKTVRRWDGERAVVNAADGSAMSFRELEVRAWAWCATHANGGAAAGLRGRAVVFALPNGVAWLEVFLGLLRAGAVPVPLDAGEPAAAQQEIGRAIRAGFWWQGGALVEWPKARRFSATTGLIKTTSGSTGKPKALLFSDEQVLADARQVTASMGIGPRDLNYALIPFGHSYGIGNLVGPLVAHGVPVVVGASSLPHAVADDFARWQPTVLPGVPAMWRALAAAEVKLDSLRLAISAGAPLAPEVAREFAERHGRKLHNFYGSSETGGIAFDRTGEATLAGGVGTAMRGVMLAVLPGKRLRVASAAVVTAGNRRRDGDLGCWVMPDRARVDPQGGVVLLGRRGRVVKIAGRRVNLEEVAMRLRRLAGGSDVWVGTSEDGRVLGAALRAPVSAAEVRVALQVDTAAWKIPKRIVVVTTWPLTERGKADTAALRARVFG